MSFLEDYNNAVIRANQFDSMVSNDANRISSDYASLVALSVRQTFGAIEITVPQRSDGSFDTSNVLTFMKRASLPHLVYHILANISSAGL